MNFTLSQRACRCRSGVVCVSPSDDESEHDLNVDDDVDDDDDDDEDDEDGYNNARSFGGLFVPRSKPRPSSPGIPIPSGRSCGGACDQFESARARGGGGGGRRDRVKSEDSFEFVEIPSQNEPEVFEAQESLQYHLNLSGGEERAKVERRYVPLQRLLLKS